MAPLAPAAAVAVVAAAALLAHVVEVEPSPGRRSCEVLARTDAGWVCGLSRRAADGAPYASFRGVPYAKPPLGPLRFQELQPPEPWVHLYDASNEGPVCPQTDVFYRQLMRPQSMSEDCIHANIHVPIDVLPTANQARLARQLQFPYRAAQGNFEEEQTLKTGAPILVFVHGGGFAFGSGDADIHGPEYLVTKGVIVITFNYRLGPFGFLSLNSTSVPGNNGLRDMVTLLRWVRRNARYFGGDPGRVTLAGQSAGAAAVHLLSLSAAAQGLFARAIVMSGTVTHSFFSTSPGYAQYVASQFLDLLAINATNPDRIHQQLVETPLQKIIEANAILLDQIGLATFVPMVESPHAGVTTILDEDPETLIAKGRGADIPFIIGFTNRECETFRPRLKEIDILNRVNKNPLLVLSPSLLYKNSIEKNLALAGEVHKRFFNGTPTMDEYVELCSETYFQYPTLKVAQTRASAKAPTFLYEFSYNADRDVVREAFGLSYNGSAHVDDLTYVFRVNSELGRHQAFPPITRDDQMKDWMTTLFTNFITCSEPTCNGFEAPKWPAVKEELVYQNIDIPKQFQLRPPSQEQREMIRFFEDLNSK